jgi:hypothetical protein
MPDDASRVPAEPETDDCSECGAATNVPRGKGCGRVVCTDCFESREESRREPWQKVASIDRITLSRLTGPAISRARARTSASIRSSIAGSSLNVIRTTAPL